MKNKKITVNINSTYKYVQLWNGIFKLTDKELTILSAFIDVNIVNNEVNLCSVKNKKEVSKVIGLNLFGFGLCSLFSSFFLYILTESALC